ncbi:ABC transporter substrate-binding protein [Hoeflea prorocentri]|uniref:Thiamine pyrimidine synthase n=2 Tax=Hoeflea prorocentri TaxID=1922333 RepID=A0A9X3UJW0_9HYPH|nr:ABC transporter substrate-binding protein [Hoeflea prorocentri]MCY6380151.1 ABC transporter substrate-binding protein [Hoeflea prorocentri]MDA5397951.1 ABC transporter substrate-binding protein [Hoeflea prorocentri]
MVSINKAAAADEFKVTMQLGWLASNGILGEVAADKLGYYKDEGLSLEIVPGGPNIDGVASVASGRANLGSISSSPSLMLARAAGIPIKCVAAGYQQHPFTYFSLTDNPVKTPKDLIGKKVATQGTARILLRALLAQNDISEDDVEVLTSGSDMAVLMTGQADVVTGWTTNVNALSVLGDKRVDLSLWDAGIQLYANPYYVTDETLAEHKDKVEAMIRVSAKGWGWVHENQEQACEFLVERYPNLDLESELKAVPLVDGYSFNAVTAKGGWGTMTRENWQAQIDAYAALDQFDGDPPKVDDMMTLSILEATAADRPKYG